MQKFLLFAMTILATMVTPIRAMAEDPDFSTAGLGEKGSPEDRCHLKRRDDPRSSEGKGPPLKGEEGPPEGTGNV